MPAAPHDSDNPTWTHQQLETIGSARELQIEPERPDGTHRRPVTIWVVRHDDDLYVRAYHGDDSHWHTTVEQTGRARIRAGGIQADVTVEETDTDLEPAIDDAYRDKYGNSSYLEPMLRPDVAATTLRLRPA